MKATVYHLPNLDQVHHDIPISNIYRNNNYHRNSYRHTNCHHSNCQHQNNSRSRPQQLSSSILLQSHNNTYQLEFLLDIRPMGLKSMSFLESTALPLVVAPDQIPVEV